MEAITVTANNVTLVLAGHTLTAVPGGVIGVGAQNVTGLTITGGTIVGFRDAGIVLNNTPNARVTGVTATGSDIRHLRRRTPRAPCSPATRPRTTRAGLTQRDHGRPARRQHGHEQRGRDNLLLNSDSNRVVGNTATGNGTIGIQVDPGSTGNQILGNTATGNGTDLVDDNPPPCVNTWQGNTFATKGGAGAACIR